MNALVLIPGQVGLRYASVALESGAVSSVAFRGRAASLPDLQTALAARSSHPAIDVVSMRALYGGQDFTAPAVLDTANENRLLGLLRQAPLAVAQTRALAEQARSAFPKIPITLAFETSFFVNLPARETTYALPCDSGIAARRWGYHGLFHEAALDHLAAMAAGGERPARVLSICLDTRPEIAAVYRRTPLLVTSGSTPVEGLPGEHSCGDIDPAIPLALASDPTVGPERTNIMLTQESGFFGLLGRPATLAEVLTSKRARMNKVRELLLYRMLLAAGSALAALEGLDAIVFSGRYAQQAAPVAEYLVPRLEQTLDLDPGTLPWQICPASLTTIVAEAGVTALLGRRAPEP
ncbi:MAG: hypothetical protein ABSB49_00840 [Polyangia bacterium]